MNWKNSGDFRRLKMQVTGPQVIPVGECKEEMTPLADELMSSEEEAFRKLFKFCLHELRQESAWLK